MKEQFSTRWGLVLATLGMAVGTGNIWRFPRVVASNGGGSFLIAWVVFLLLWSVPLMLVEFAFGKRARLGTVGAFRRLAGDRFAWMGGWVALCATAIMFYYSVVTGWCFRYLFASLSGELAGTDPGELWESFTGSWLPVGTHVVALAAGVAVVWFGVRGIERVTRILIPILFLLMIVLAARAVTLPGAEHGLAFLFEPQWSRLANGKVWLEALTQNAWDTGAGWGLILTYAIYMKAREDVALNPFLIGFGNNSVSLLAGIAVLCTVFAINPGARDQIVGAGNEGLTFIWMPQLFRLMPGGAAFMVIFFLALSVAALTSLISMLELASRILMDAGISRRRALRWLAGAALVFGLPSALSIDVLHNQDWVWGVGLMLSGLFFALAARRFGIERLRVETVNGPGADIRIGRWWTTVVAYLVPIEAATLLVWWLWQERASWNPISPGGVGTVAVQWAVALVCLILFNRRLAGFSRRGGDPEEVGS